MRVDDRDLLCLLVEIIDSANQLTEQKGGGLPIGNLTSQFFANLYLNELDYFVKFDLRAKFYLRYMDDFLIFSNGKKELLEIKGEIRDFLKDRLALDLQDGKSQVYKTKNGIKFLGFRIFRDYRRLTSDNMRRFRKRIRRFNYLLNNEKIEIDKVRDSVRCWVAHSHYANTYGLRNRINEDLCTKDEDFGQAIKDILLWEREVNFVPESVNLLDG